MMTEKKRQLKNQLDHELKSLHFSKQKDVLERTHPVTWRQKASKLWNKEINIPLVPVSALCVVLLLLFGYKEMILPEMDNTTVEKELIDVAGNMYWKDDFEKVMIKHED